MGSCTKLRKRHIFTASGQGKPPCFLGSAVAETALPKNNTWGKERRNQQEVLRHCGLLFAFYFNMYLFVFRAGVGSGMDSTTGRNEVSLGLKMPLHDSMPSPTFACLLPLIQAHL